MKILLIGSGGREHSMAWALNKSPLLTKLYCTPGNAGIAKIAECIELDVSKHIDVIEFCQKQHIDFVIVGPEIPLVAGLIDDLEAANIKAFGPTKEAAQLEGSKSFTKNLCADFNIPTAAYGHFTDAENALAYVREQGAPIVIKADGLAAGKGVIMAETLEEAEKAIRSCFDGLFGESGSEIIIEEWMIGEEASFFALVDGETVIPLIAAQDHKRAFDGDKGLNTGGMGAYSPAPVMTDAMCQRTMDEILVPTAKALLSRGIYFKGIFYAGLMITKEGPKLIEYNVRFGDPECQVLMMRLKSDLLEALLATSEGNLANITLDWHEETAVTVVMASKGYPGSYDKGTPISNLAAASENENVEIFHAGTSIANDQLIATGGRVLNITAIGNSVKEARDKAYNAIHKIEWENGFYRSDIGWRAIEREEAQE